MVTLTMILGSAACRFKEKVGRMFRLHREMDSEMFEDFFRTMSKMNTCIEATCDDINAEVKCFEI